MTSRSLVPLFFSAGVAWTVVACGGAESASSPAKSASPRPREEAPEPAPTTVEEAQAQIARASDALNGRSAKTTATTATTPPDEAKAGPAGSSAKAEERSADSASSARLSNDACVDPCRALASMRRAVDALCRMTGDTDKRCVDARGTLSDSVTRTSSCKCS